MAQVTACRSCSTRAIQTARYDPAHVEKLVREADHVLVAIADPARHVIPIARRLGVPLWTDLHDAHGQADYIRDFLAADYVFLSGDGLPDPRPLMERLVADGRRLVVCTRGPSGAVALTSEGSWLEVPAEPVEAVDTNGAGDAFLAGTLYGELLGLPFERSLRIGARVAAMAVTSLELAGPDLSAASLRDWRP
jgi:sugar/nucleoside kinase (ribokinase family)